MTKPTLLVLSVVLALTFAFAHAGSLRFRRQIPAEFRNVNIENYLKNPRAVHFQLKCVIYDGPCDRIGKYLKITIPELLTNQCRNCNPDQRKQAGRLVAYIQQNYPREWDDAIKKFQGGKVLTASDVKRFESEFGIKVEGVSTEAPAPGETTVATPAGPPSSVAPVSLAEVGAIIKGFKATEAQINKAPAAAATRTN
jgi:hypothetical protein